MLEHSNDRLITMKLKIFPIFPVSLLLALAIMASSCRKDDKETVKVVKLPTNVLSVTTSEYFDKIVDEFKPANWAGPDEPDDFWSVRHSGMKDFALTLPESVSHTYLTPVSEHWSVTQNPSLLSDPGAKWALISEFKSYREGNILRGARITPVDNTSFKRYILVYVDIQLTISGRAANGSEGPEYIWNQVDLKQGWNYIQCSYFEGDRIYSSVPAGSSLVWQLGQWY